MTTALDIIKTSLRLLGVYSKGEEADPDETSDGLAALNALMGSMSNTPLVYAKTLDSIALTAGVASITVGPGTTPGQLRPVRVLEDSYIQHGEMTYPLSVFTEQQYGDIALKNTQGIPEVIWPLMSMPDAQITFWPVPTSGLTLKLWSIKALSSFPTLTTEVSLPPGYEDLLPLELAKAISSEYQTALPRDAEERRRGLRRALKRTNLQVPQIDQPDDCATDNALRPL